MSNKFDKTVHFKLKNDSENLVRDTLKDVYSSLNEKGYDPVNQLVGYIISGDPAYITSYNDARNKIKKIDRNELVEELLNSYLKNI